MTGIPVFMAKTNTTPNIGTVTTEAMDAALEALGRLEAHTAHGLMSVLGAAAFDKAKSIAQPIRNLLATIIDGNADDDDEGDEATQDSTTKQ